MEQHSRCCPAGRSLASASARWRACRQGSARDRAGAAAGRARCAGRGACTRARPTMSKNPLTMILETNKFNGTNYNDWLRNLRIVLDFENQTYVLDKPLPVTLPEGSTPEERVTFERWREDNRKVRSVVLASMTNDIQKQYDRHDDVASIMLRMKELEDLQAGLDNDTYIDVILQSLPLSYDLFVVNYNMNGLEMSINELINIVQYEATTKKSEPSVLVGEASTSKAKGKGARRWKRKKGKAKAAASTLGVPVTPVGMGKGKGKVLERSRKLSRDEVVLKLGDGKAVAAEAVGHDLIMTAQNKHKMDNQDNAQIWHARLGHISQDRIKRLVDSKSLEIDDLDHLPACESCLKGKMTKKPFVGQSTLASGLLDLIHSDVCGPLNTQARGGFSYFITFTDDHSR
ncbi:UNVERIFIED_CONTAM: hypothetical protein Sradi_7296700, partial [Sesamum radiatum]